MELTVFGATGGVGREVVRQALEAGHEVTAVVRDPARLGLPDRPRLHVATVADLRDEDALVPLLEGRDAVVSALGAANNQQARRAPVTGPALRAVVRAMDRAGVHRLTAVSAAPVGPDAPADGVLTRAVFLPLLRRALRDLYADLADMEAVLTASRVDWTVVRPPKLTHGRHTGVYRRAVDEPLPRARTISRADVADALLAFLTDPTTSRRAVVVAS
ncbi:NAD(P)-dependent oxidoreductase [Streptomyces sp. WAC06614]|uniref:NAD(P)-dependent oxidoreductase n=1 Tax=Streptomyces sp. WAC06614 TaxID=2487416 RepID=UPI000F797B1B|nr:NAD(P)H-binding protein [Streptomyces sp. WAC06614]RSS79120.1 NAD-dependent epimerase/dehydratase family protein [Streptomyces sp. WAC06614]